MDTNERVSRIRLAMLLAPYRVTTRAQAEVMMNAMAANTSDLYYK